MRISKRSNSESSQRKAKTKLPIDTAPPIRNRSDEAKARLGVDPELVRKSRKITPLLRDSGLTRDRVIEILESDDSPDSVTFIAKVHSISASDLPCLSLEEITIAAGLTTRRLWELIQGARLEQSQDAVKIMVADSAPKVMAAVIKAATEERPIFNKEGEIVGYLPGDMKATELIWKANGTLPTPKGMTINLNQQNNSLPLDLDEEDEDELPLAGMDSTLKDFQRVVSAPALEPPKPVEVPMIEAEFEEVPISVLRS